MPRPLIAVLAVTIALAGAASAHAARSFTPVLSAGSGAFKVRYSACLSGALLYERATVRKTTDRRYPRITVHVEEGSGVGDSEYSIFPPQHRKTYHSGDWTTAATIDVKIDPARGKTKRRQLTVGDVGTC